MTIKIRKAELRDCETLARFNSLMAKETEGKDLEWETALRGAKAIIKDEHKGFYLVAETDNKIVAQLLVTPEWSDWRNMFFWWIQSVYVSRDYRRQGIFSTLFRHLEDRAYSKKHVAGLRLYVEKNNQNAMSTYEELGMYNPGYQMYEILLEKKNE